MSVTCSPECINIACKNPDWLETHESFVITMAGLLGGGLGCLLTYFLKSRCSEIKFCCFFCKREVLQTSEVNLEN